MYYFYTYIYVDVKRVMNFIIAFLYRSESRAISYIQSFYILFKNLYMYIIIRLCSYIIREYTTVNQNRARMYNNFLEKKTTKQPKYEYIEKK